MKLGRRSTLKETKALVVVAVASACMASLLCYGLLVEVNSGCSPAGEASFTIERGGWHAINESLSPGDRWNVGYQASNAFVRTYLMSNTQFYDFYYMGGLRGYIDSCSGASGRVDYTAALTDRYFVVFFNDASLDAELILDIVEVDHEEIPIPEF